jgi:hypothetical protein
MNLGILPNLTKDYILSNITQEQIFEHYLGISVEIDKLIKVPSILRIDKNPTASFYYNINGKLRFRDLSGGFWGDCFDLVGYLSQVNANNKRGFAFILEKIAKDFGLHKYSKEYLTTIKTINVESFGESNKKTKKVIEIKSRPFNNIDASFWIKGNIKKSGLDEYYVKACEYIWLNNDLIYTFNINDPAYAYYFGTDNNGVKDIRIYFPFRKEYRFISNCSPLQGYKQLQPDYIGIITKSYKDVISLKSFGIQSVAPSSESILLSKDDWYKIKYTCSHWFSLMDYDITGIKMMYKLRKAYNIQPLYFSNLNLFKSDDKNRTIIKKGKIFKEGSNFGVKDFFEFVEKSGTDKVKETIIQTKELYIDNLEQIDNDINNNLQFLKYGI